MYFTEVKTHKARKDHRCEWCWQSIDKGEEYKRYRYYDEAEAATVKLHPEVRVDANVGVNAMGKTLDLDDVAATSETAKHELANLRELVAVLTERLKAAEETVCSTKRERDCTTAEDWKRKATHYEYQWRSCSEFANRRIGELTSNAKSTCARRASALDEMLCPLTCDMSHDIMRL